MAHSDDKLIQQIAAQVIAALGRGTGAGPVAVHAPAGVCTGDYSKFAELKGLQTAPPPVARADAKAASSGEELRRDVDATLLSGMVTAAQLRNVKGVVRLAKGAKLTPLARDFVAQKKLQVLWEDGMGAGSGLGGNVPPSKRESGSAPPLKTAGLTGNGGLNQTKKRIDMTQNMFQLKQEMCEVGHRIWQKGFCAGNEGNHSVRISDDRVLCTPTGFSKGFLRPEMITVVDMDGEQVDKENKYKRTSEILLHLSIYKHRPDVRAVIHSHPPHATAFACAGVPIPEGIHPEAEVFLGKVPTAKYTTPSYKELGESCCKLITPETNTVLLGNHGTVSFSTSPMETYYKLEIIDAYCRILLLIKQVGKVNFLSQQEMIDLLKVKEKFGIPDSRLKCAPSGCVGTDNQPYLSTFPDTTVASASCDCETGNVVQSGGGMNDAAFEAMVQRVTDQIMAAGR